MQPIRSDNSKNNHHHIVRRNAASRTDNNNNDNQNNAVNNVNNNDFDMDTSESKSSYYYYFHKTDSKSKIHKYKFIGRSGIIMMVLLLLIVFLCKAVVVPFRRNVDRNTISMSTGDTERNQQQQPRNTPQDLPPGLNSMLERAVTFSQSCRNLQASPQTFTGFDTRSILPFHNDTVASLPSFGIIDALQQVLDDDNNHKKETSSWPTCSMPPSTECDERQFTVVFMAYNPDRLGITFQQIKTLLSPEFQNLVYEIVLVWNGERHVDESKEGRTLLEYIRDKHPVRIVYPLKMGFPNDLFNRYHPDVVQVSKNTKAILYYDDDGPFYSFAAIRAGFELWKRHANVQIGAMARQITYSQRQVDEHKSLLLGTVTPKEEDHRSNTKPKPADDRFVSHCTNVNDQVDYQFRFFANYDANMVLPSGSFLHSNYLCFLWHPVFAEIRKFVLLHPVHPDDMTVSMIVSQLSGKAPRVYSRRLNPPDRNKKENKKASIKQQEQQQKQRRRRLHVESKNHTVEDWEPMESEVEYMGMIPQSEIQRHRRLLFSICWDCGSGMTEMKQFWAELRTEAVNALVRYFGSINSGSIGWCPQDSEYYKPQKDGRCDPVMARQGWLPWMNEDGTPKNTCP
jgi:hypothetical protein